METMKDIKARFASAKEGEYNALFRHYENDERSGVQKACSLPGALPHRLPAGY